MATLQHLGDPVLPGLSGRGVAVGSAVDLQLGPGRAVHQHRVHGPSGASGHPDQHGRSGTGP